jgi:two-component system, NtrC family, sensor kinase
VFLPFYSTKTSNGENMGLGLSVSYGIVKRYHGKIAVSSERDKGTEFVISFPLATG